MTTEQVRGVVRGFTESKCEKVGKTMCEVEAFHFKFGIFKKLDIWPEHGRLRVFYDEDGKVSFAAAEYD
jgi:hypothetical protein